MGCGGSSHAQRHPSPSHSELVVVADPQQRSGEPTESPPAEVSAAPAANTNTNTDEADALELSPPQACGVVERGSAKQVDEHGRRFKASHTAPPTVFKPQSATHNGFKVINEALAFTCSPENVAPYTLPLEALTFVPAEAQVVTHFANGDQERKIHCNIRLTEHEMERLQSMRHEAKAQSADFYPSVTAMATRFLSRARMEPKKAVRLMRETQDWRAEFFNKGPVREEDVRDDMKHGIVYFTGRDTCLRPAIVIRVVRIPAQWYADRQIDKFIRLLIYCMEYFLRYMVVPGRVENLTVIADLQGLGFSQVPIGPLGDVYKVMSHHYIGRVFKFYVINVSLVLSTMARVATSLLTDRQKQKLNMLDDVKELRKEFACSQLEKDLGGTRDKIREFFPFPVRPGPFTAGYSGDPDLTAVPNVHEVFAETGPLGRLWDKKLSDECNQRLEYGPKAADILKRCNLPVPPELFAEPVRPDMHSRPIDAAAVASDLDTIISSQPAHEEDGNDSNNDSKNIVEDEDPHRDESCGRGFFCCR